MDAEAAGRLLGYGAQRRPRANRLMRAAERQSRLTSRTGAAARARDTLLRAIPTGFHRWGEDVLKPAVPA